MLQVSYPSIAFPAIQVIDIFLMFIGFSLETYVPISPIGTSILDPSEKELYTIPYIIRYIEHFCHLVSMDSLMVQGAWIQYSILSTEENATDIHSLVPLERKDIVSDY